MSHKLKVLFILLFVWTLSPADVSDIDADSDGVNDFKDACLETPQGYYVDLQGCESFVIIYPDFSKNSISISEDVEKDINILVNFLIERPQINIKITGHSSRTAVSGDAYNLKLSKKRADMFKEELLKRGVSKARILTAGKGFHQPMLSNDTEEGRAKNRRLEIEFLE